MSTPGDMELAKRVDVGEITPTELVEEILDDALYNIMIQHPHWGLDTLYLARRIVAALQY